MQVASEHLGSFEVDPATIVRFPQGLLGFPDATAFAVVDADDSGLYYWLQSVDDPALAFLCVVPWPFFPEYEPEVPEADTEALELDEPSDAAVYCLVTIRDDGVTANLLGPLVVNARTRVGRQLVLAESGYSVRAVLGAR